MRYPLDCKIHFQDTYLFWLSRFLRYKITSLSNRNVTNQDLLFSTILNLKNGILQIDDMNHTVKEIRNIGINSIHVYYLPLKKLFDYLITLKVKSMKDIDEDLLSDYLATATSRLSDATKKNYRIALLNFFGYIDKQTQESNGYTYRYGIELKNWGGLGGKSGTKLPSYMTKSEVQRFITAIDEFPYKTDILGARNRLIIKIILYTGIRVGEAISIKTKDMIKDNNMYIIQVKGKGNKPRVVMIKESIIRLDLETYKQYSQCEDNLLICNKSNKKITQAYISRLIEYILLYANIRKDKNGAHMLRHTFATLLYQNSQDLILVQESLGHADINTSRIYTHFDQSRLIKTTDIF